ncbi:MAG: pilus assembly protein CpaE [Alphaproteobacteria bacterium]|nr:MAG: pilus assembly protein CpaE [Alphaproteobacteria bacterium]
MGASAARKQEDEAQVAACAIARDLQSFDLLIEDMEAEMGPAWGGLAVEDALIFLEQPEAQELEFLAIALDRDDEGDLSAFAAIIRAAKAIGVKVILIAQDVSPMALHQLMRLGADDFLPYPLPEGALAQSIERVRMPAVAPATAVSAAMGKGGPRNGVIIPVHGIAGGVGATMLTVNLAWELSEELKKHDKRVCILDLDVQFGSVATYLDLPRKEAVFELLSDTEAMDEDSFRQALQCFNDQLAVLTAPADAIPLDFLTKDDVNRLFDVATAQFDFVFVDMPTALVTWSEAAINRAAVYFAALELDMRSAQNALRFIRTLKAEELPFEKVRYVLNRAPGFTDLSGKGRVKRLAESLDISFGIQLPDGGRPVTEAGDHGLPLAQSAPKNAVRKEIQKHAKSLADLAGDAAKEG